MHNPLLTGAVTWQEWLDSMQYEAVQGYQAVLELMHYPHTVGRHCPASNFFVDKYLFLVTGPPQDDTTIQGIVSALTNLTTIVTQQMQMQVSRHFQVCFV